MLPRLYAEAVPQSFTDALSEEMIAAMLTKAAIGLGIAVLAVLLAVWILQTWPNLQNPQLGWTL